jgi:hypothetical protein
MQILSQRLMWRQHRGEDRRPDQQENHNPGQRDGSPFEQSRAELRSHRRYSEPQ